MRRILLLLAAFAILSLSADGSLFWDAWQDYITTQKIQQLLHGRKKERSEFPNSAILMKKRVISLPPDWWMQRRYATAIRQSYENEKLARDENLAKNRFWLVRF